MRSVSAHPRVRPRRDNGLRAKGDAEAGGAKHVEIVGAVADRDDLLGRNPMRGGLFLKRR